MNTKSINYYHKALYTKSAHTLGQLPKDEGLEVAFAGRSNAGKSSALNTLADHKNLARTSKTPGRTQQINFFQLDENRSLVDLPGYGYAKVPLKIKEHWQHTLQQYLETRQALKGLVLLMDIRHPLTEYDVQMLHWCYAVDMSVHVLLTKADKVSRGAGCNTLNKVKQDLKTIFQEANEQWCSVQLFSSLTKIGVDECRAKLNGWFDFSA